TGALGFIASPMVWAPGLVAAVLAWGLIGFRAARAPAAVPWRPWGTGVFAGLSLGAIAVVALAAGLAAVSNPFSPAALGDPLTGLVESVADTVASRGPTTPRQLVLDAALPKDLSKAGAARVGWPSRHECPPHPYARPLDFEREPPKADARGRELLRALRRVSAALPEDERLSVVVVMLEGFRADDLNALNPAAPRELAPFMNELYERAAQPGSGVLVSRSLFQAGVRTAHALGALTCGLGTLPYNLSFIRDLQPISLRCTSDVLTDAGFVASFFYGSDPTFDAMDVYLKEHHFSRIVGQSDFPKDAPKGTWDGITDFAVFDDAVAKISSGAETGPQLAMVMSLSHHSPFTPPQDLPPAVRERVGAALAGAPNRADADDRRRLEAYSYTDAAVERLFAKLDATGLAERTLVLVVADHSTGHSYVWGAEPTETDAQKARVPMALVLPKALRARATDAAALDAALADAQRLVDQGPLSQNDVPALLLALTSSHPKLKQLPQLAHWHTLGGQVTSPYFEPGGGAGAYLLGINGVSELFALNAQGERAGDYEDSVFLKTRADRYRVTPRLIPVAALLGELLDPRQACP
ncbi:MAG: LTA synthase family protein, partial [Myxococcaceae bacterium]|nr:LTA synthase family protein [Myxococcaceae bacterium]